MEALGWLPVTPVACGWLNYTESGCDAAGHHDTQGIRACGGAALQTRPFAVLYYWATDEARRKILMYTGCRCAEQSFDSHDIDWPLALAPCDTASHGAECGFAWPQLPRDPIGKVGGYILAPCHSIQVVDPLGNVVAVYETVYEKSWSG